MSFADAMASVPFIIIALGVLAVFGSSPLLFVFLVGVFNWWRYTRLTRALVISANEEGYAEAARIVGVPPLRLYLRHVLPNIAGPLIVQFTVNFPEIILLESGLSFLGLGIQPPATSLGTDGGRRAELPGDRLVARGLPWRGHRPHNPVHQPTRRLFARSVLTRGSVKRKETK